MSYSMLRFRFLLWVKGFIHILEGLILVLTLGLVNPRWTTAFGCWMCDIDW